ncbi:TetR/AcrR family transcriptional regulator [Variovorax sp. J31P207]|uniref:TetR/AcrR family transcriptional regulator n=1 Tax=Variovorax sp. J31P207 TaxID=3053510 RepID=UPI0025789979|nr:TetR/AcrR family transcriptional regulator [Variovorax sp. J31P207]MDM0066594.1 TetR/AcrR family transcriptional regulator [Variovorax sp. J31P207]
MVRPREFDKEEVLQKATRVFWEHGFSASSTDLLLKEMSIGRQTLYNTFGDKRQLYLEVLRSYQEQALSGHLERLNTPESPLQGIRQLLLGLAPADDSIRALGCFGVGSVGEFGTSDPVLMAARASIQAVLQRRIESRVREGQNLGELDASLSAKEVAAFIQTAMVGLQISARAGADVRGMHAIANFTADRLKAV